ncbi:EhaE family protein [Methanothermobacter sp. K4]|uniref:EhaE family protein n=1 Tax=Methanothermobacter sp. K4 TaxID=2913262 RepID=UPI001ED9F57F|nr:EhaE family protein [Methanothermobacter sp. K4]MCG2828398.1 EhaE family protein [Methanothermobacter sp. K4]
MLETQIWFYAGAALVIIGSIATVTGPGVRDPIVRILNTEIPAVGVSLIFLTYNHTLALLTFIAATTIMTLVLLRAVIRLEEMGVEG